MDILIVTDRWDPHGGGRERYLDELRESLSRRGHSVAIETRSSLGDRRLGRRIHAFRAARSGGAVVTAMPVRAGTHYQLHSGVYANAYAAEREAYDSTLRRLCFWPALRLNRKRSRLLTLEEHVLGSGSGPQLMALSAQTRDEIQRAFGTADQRITVARPGVDLRVFSPDPAESPVCRDDGPGRHVPRRVRLLFVGHNFVLKGLRWAIEALARARKGGIDAELLVAGHGSIRRFVAVADSLGIASHVRFAGVLPRPVLAATYRRSDLLIHPTFYDPFPRSLVEALACGCPVLTTRACGAAEIISPGENGFVVSDPRDVDALAAAIAAMADCPRRTLMRTAAAAVGRTFDFEAHVDAVSQWLQS